MMRLALLYISAGVQLEACCGGAHEGARKLEVPILLGCVSLCLLAIFTGRHKMEKTNSVPNKAGPELSLPKFDSQPADRMQVMGLTWVAVVEPCLGTKFSHA